MPLLQEVPSSARSETAGGHWLAALLAVPGRSVRTGRALAKPTREVSLQDEARVAGGRRARRTRVAARGLINRRAAHEPEAVQAFALLDLEKHGARVEELYRVDKLYRV